MFRECCHTLCVDNQLRARGRGHTWAGVAAPGMGRALGLRRGATLGRAPGQARPHRGGVPLGAGLLRGGRDRAGGGRAQGSGTRPGRGAALPGEGAPGVGDAASVEDGYSHCPHTAKLCSGPRDSCPFEASRYGPSEQR
jgi:hypothetical protein